MVSLALDFWSCTFLCKSLLYVLVDFTLFLFVQILHGACRSRRFFWFG